MNDNFLPKVYIIILNYNTWADTIECLESVLRNDYPNYQIVVVDNNSPNNSMEYIKAWAEGKLDVWVKPDDPLKHLSFPVLSKPLSYTFYKQQSVSNKGDEEYTNEIVTQSSPLILIQAEKNLGFSHGINIALRFLFNKNDEMTSIVWLLNPDMVVDKDTLNCIVNCYKFYCSDKVILGTTVKNYYDSDQILYFGGARILKWLGVIRFIKSENKIGEIDFISGGNLITSLLTFKEVGFLSEDYFLYWEDADWCTKAKLKGYRLKVCNDCVVYDKGGTSIGRYSVLGSKYYIRNSLLFLKKYYYPCYIFLKIFLPARILISRIKLIIRRLIKFLGHD